MRRLSPPFLGAMLMVAQSIFASMAAAQPAAAPTVPPPPPPSAPPPAALPPAPPPSSPPPATVPAAPPPDASAPSAPATATQAPYPPPPQRSRDDDDRSDRRDRRERSAKDVRPRRLDYRPGEVIPPGYIEQDRNDRGLLISGIVLFSSFYGVSLATAAVGSVDDREPERWGPLLIPIAGPLVTIGTLETEGAGTYLMVLDTLGQVAGVVLFATSFAARDHYLKRVEDVPEVSMQAGFGSATFKLTY